PVCLASIITGTGPDQHRIPSLGWYDRGRDRFVEYGSSFAAAAVEGTWRGVQDVMVDLNHQHLAESTSTLFEVVQDSGKRAASINYLVSRGRTRHNIKHNYGPMRAFANSAKVSSAYGPDHMYLGELYGSLKPLLPQVGFKRPKDWGGGHIARYLMRNTGVEFVVLYLGEHDHKSHMLGPDATQQAINVADRALGKAMSSLGGIEPFLEKFAVLICADHGQTRVHEHAAIEDVFDDVTLFRGSRTSVARDCDLAIVGSNRVAMAYRTRQLHHGHARASEPGYMDGPSDRWIAERGLESPANDLSIFREGDEYVVLGGGPGGGELRAHRDPTSGRPTLRSRMTDDPMDRWAVSGDRDLLDLGDDEGVLTYRNYPDALLRISSALRCVNTGDVLFSSKPGWEFHDIGGTSHAGGSHGSLHVSDSTAPLLSIGLEGATPEGLGTVRLTDIAGLVTSHLGIGAAMGSGAVHSRA
ncbi:MAG: alkaline phosphatase family protein, partial [Thermoleophilia bacterium]|nr:alkaline phosphatase family protein [Thermoleophilia bacterium]